MRPLAQAFAIDVTTLSALRLPPDLECVRFRRSTIPNPVASIVVPVRNRRHTLGRALTSALALNEAVPIEVIVVDDGSDDGTTELVGILADARISAVGLRKCRGANTARNVGIAIARAPVVAFLDSDDDYMEGRLADPLRLLAKHPNVGIVLSSFVARKGEVARVLRLRECIYDSGTFLRLIAGYVLPPSTSGLTIRRDVLLACGGFDPEVKRMQDRDLLLRLAPTTNAAASAVVSWRKYWGFDGISSSRLTYYEALCEFLKRHPIYGAEKLTTRDYLITRHLIALIKRGYATRALEVYRHARTSLSPRVAPLPLLLISYLKTKRRRRRVASQFLSKDSQLTGL